MPSFATRFILCFTWGLPLKATALPGWILLFFLLAGVPKAQGQVLVTLEPGEGPVGSDIIISRPEWGKPDQYALALPSQSCGQLTRLRVEVRLDSGPDHAAAGNFTTSQPVSVTVRSTSGPANPVTFTPTLVITQQQPEQVHLLDLSSFLRTNATTQALEVRVSVPTPPTSTGTPPTTQRVSLRCVPEYETQAAASFIVTAAPIVPVAGFEQTLRWTSSCPLVGSYQVQVLHRPVKVARMSSSPSIDPKYDPGMRPPNNSALWDQKGLLLETGSANQFYKLTLAEGDGTYHWRVRAIGTQPGDATNPANWGPWSLEDAQFSLVAPDAASNWIYSRSFSENGHVAEKLTFATGLQQVRQTQTRLASPTQPGTELGEQVVAVQTLQDFAGRDAVTSLPIPVQGVGAGALGFKRELLTRAPRVPYEAAHFDQATSVRNPEPAQEQGYYSRNNDRVADAEGYPFSRTIFSNDGTNRVVEQGGVGDKLRVRPSDAHTVRTSYNSVAPQEVIRLFGREAPEVQGLYKVVTTDPNNISSVTYQTKEGKTIATALSGKGTSALDNVPGAEANAKRITETIQGQGQIISKTLTLTEESRVEIAYSMTPAQLRVACGAIATYCASCDYQVRLRIIDLNDEAGSAQRFPIAPWVVNGQGDCKTPESEKFHPAIDLRLPAGTYRIEREVVPVDYYPLAATTLPVRTLTGYLSELKVALEGKIADAAATGGALPTQYDTPLALIRYYLDPARHDVDQLYAKLDGRNLVKEDYEGQLCYKIPVGDCGDFIYLPRLTDYCPAPVNLTSPEFEAQLEAELARLNLIPEYSATPHSLVEVLATAGYAPGQLNALVANMAASPSYLTTKQKEDMVKCWDGILAGLEVSLYRGEGRPAEYTFDIVHEYLQCTGMDLTMPVTKANFDVTLAFKQFVYDPTNKGHLECIRGVAFDEKNPTRPLPEFRYALDNFSSYSVEQRNSVYNCLRGAANPSTSPMNLAEATAQAAQLVQQAQQTCEDRRDEFRRVLIVQLHQQGKYVKEDVYVWAPGSGGQVPTITETLLGKGTQRISSCDIEILVQGMVEQCQNDCVLTPVRDDRGNVIAIGNKEEHDKLRQVMFSDLQLYVKDSVNTSPPSTYALVPPAGRPVYMPTNKMRLISFKSWVSPRVWEQHPSQYASIALQGGRKYYIEALQKNVFGPDNLAVGWKLPGSTAVEPISGQYLSPFTTNTRENPAAGTIQLERWDKLDTNPDVASLPTLTPPSLTAYPSLFEAPSNYGELTGSRMRGYLTPPRDGYYMFYLASDDYAELWLSPVCPPSKQHQLYYGWGPVNAGAEINKGPLAEVEAPAFDPETKLEDCKVVAARRLLDSYNQQRDSWVQDQLTAFTEHFQQQCVTLASQQEKFTITYDLGYHHFTLYYYDRAGNLIKTVPPAGVQPLEESVVASLLSKPRSDWPVVAHRLATTYTYNSLHQLEKQKSPDGGETHFFYNRKGQLRFSQNARQRAALAYSYTRYDALGRVTEVGESSADATAPSPTGQQLPKVLPRLEDMSFPPAAAVRQVTRTGYGDQMQPDLKVQYRNQAQRYLTNRVAYSYYDVDGMPSTKGDNSYTYYSYDPHGNVEWLGQQQPGLGSKFVRYQYDLISNKVTQVLYQEGSPDQFYHRYRYDADNRLTQVQTSADGVLWDQDARYTYFAHGPLKRLELGEDHVQGLDYTYTLQGWLKGVNHPGQDPGQDGTGTGLTTSAKDAFGMSLNYFAGDYTSNNAAWVNGAGSVLQPQHNLYNGNIAAWTTKTRNDLSSAPQVPAAEPTVGEQYRYDQLNRLRSSTTSYHNAASGTFGATQDYATSYAYDANGNLTDLTRNGAGRFGQLEMDRLTYTYDTGNGRDNRLLRVNDPTPNQSYYEDVKHTPAGDTSPQYGYDEIGNLTSDATSGVTKIEWNVYGKIAQVTHQDGRATTYAYDAQGNRVRKSNMASNGSVRHTYYVRDAQGNVLAIYEQDVTNGTAGSVRLTEQPLYGSSRLGVRKLAGTPAAAVAGVYARTLGQKQYELVDHLGNVRALVGDTKRVDEQAPGTYKPDLLAYYNYYPFGQQQPGRTAPSNQTQGGGYRYGFNGKEKDNNGELGLTTYDYGFRIYNPGIARFLSEDPLTKDYPWYTPYQFAGNNPIKFIDLDGLEEYDPTKDIFFTAKLILTPFYDVKHSVENLLLNTFVPADPGKKWQASYKVTENGNQQFETEIKQVPVGGVIQESVSKALDIVNVVGAGKFTPTDILAAKTNGKTESTKIVREFIGAKGPQINSKTLWQQKGSSARIDVENPAPGKRDGQVHYQDDKNNKYLYDSENNSFLSKDPKTNSYTIEAPKAINDLLNNREIKAAVDKGMKYLNGE